MNEPIEDIQARLSRLEAEVAQLSARLRAQESAATPAPTSPRPLPPRPAPVRKEPSEPRNPVVIVAAVGAGIFLLGAVFFLHLAIQRGWIGPEMRFLLGLVVGGTLTAWAAKLVLGESRALGACLLLAGLGTLVFSLRVGSFNYHFFPPALGLAGTALATLVAGGLAARARFSPVMALSLVVGFLAPLIFSQGGHHEIALSIYLSVLVAASLAVPYLAQVGARWTLVRWLLLVGTWGLVAGACSEVQILDAPVLMALLAFHLLLAGLWIWLPRIEEVPTTPVVLWFLLNLAFTSLLWVLWLRLDWMREGFTVPVILIALLNLLLVKPVRTRLGSRRGDLGLLVLAVGHLALAVPVALDWAWVGPLWGLFALGLAWAVGYTQRHPDWGEEEVLAMRLLAIGMSLLATGTWLFHLTGAFLFSGDRQHLPFFNRPFLEGLLASLAWLLLIKDSARPSKILGFLGLQIVGALTLAFELAHLVRYAGGSNRAGSVVITVVWTLLGAGQWLRSLTLEEGRRPIAIAGYIWLAVASFKLIALDLSSVDTPQRALAFLAVGAVFLAAALIANQVKRQRGEAA